MDIWDSWWVLQLMQMLGLFSFWISFTKFRTLFSRAFGFGHNIIKGSCNAWIFGSFNGLVTTGSLISLFLVLSLAYSYAFPSSQSVIQSYDEIPKNPHSLVQSNETLKPNVSMGTCNVFEGSWIRDDSYPLYDASHCPFAERGFNCIANGRKDRGYTKWRWKPKNCDIPRFDANRILEHLRGKRVVFVGDSLSRTQWESLICLLMTGVEDKKSVYEIKGNKITKQIRFLGVRFSTFDVRIDFYRSVFLVKPGMVPRHAPQRVKTTLRLDEIDDISHEWIDSDVLIFNSGHWWTRTKLFDVGRNHNACKVTRKPWKRTNGKDQNPISDMINRVVKRMSVPVTVLHVTPMDAYRSDGHVGTWSENPSVPDCSHWCLPGVPDTWNEILFSYLLPKDGAN